MSTPSSSREGSLRAGRRGRPLVAVAGSLLLLGSIAARGASAQQPAAPAAQPTWVDQIAGPAYGYARALVVQGSDVYVATNGSDASGASSPVFLRKYRTDGTLSWARTLDTGTTDDPALWADHAGVCIAGATRATLDDPPEPFADSVGFVRCLDPDGNPRWTRYVEAQTGDRSPQVVVYAVAGRASEVYVVGTTSDPLADCAPEACVGGGGWDGFIRKYSRDGVPGWTRQSTTLATDYSRGVAVDPSGDVSVWGVERVDRSPAEYVIHLTRYTADGAPQQAGIVELGTRIPYDAAFAKSTLCLASQAPDPDASSGIASDLRCYAWPRQGEPEIAWQDSLRDTWVNDVVTLPSGLLVAGLAYPPLPGQQGAGGFDGFVRSYEFAGESWTLEFGTPLYDEASAVALEAGRVLVAGSTAGAMDPGSDGAPPSGIDAYVACLGEPFAATAGGPYSVDEGSTVVLSAGISAGDGHKDLTYAWDLDRDGSFEAVGQTVPYTPRDGTGDTVTVRVVVADTISGATAVAGSTVTVANVAPVVDALPDVFLKLGQPLSGRGGFADPGADTWTAFVDYGDASASEVQELSERTFELAHPYGAPGTYPVTVTVRDKDGGMGTTSFAVVVSGDIASIAKLIEEIEALVRDKVINPGQGNSFVTKLRDAQVALDGGDTSTAAETLRAFIHEVKAYEKAGPFLEHGKRLTAAAESIIASLSV